MAVATEEQLGLDEIVVENPELLEALELRQDHKDALSAQRKEYREAHEAATAILTQLELPEDRVARVGRFRISKRDVPEREVSFTSGARSQLSIAVVSDED